MLCERCKVREANIQYTEIVGGVKTEHHFCAQCAKELDFGPYSAIFDSEFPLGDPCGLSDLQDELWRVCKEQSVRLSGLLRRI